MTDPIVLAEIESMRETLRPTRDGALDYAEVSAQTLGWLLRINDTHSSMHQQLTAAQQRIVELEGALELIAEWRMPRTGLYHPDGSEQSYGWANGSNGEREFVRDVAKAALRAGQGGGDAS